MRILTLAVAVALAGCSTAQIGTLTADVTTGAKVVQSLCGAVPDIAAQGANAATVATLPAARIAAATDAATAIAAKCSAAATIVANVAPLTPTLINLVSQQAQSDLAADIVAVKTAANS